MLGNWELQCLNVGTTKNSNSLMLDNGELLVHQCLTICIENSYDCTRLRNKHICLLPLSMWVITLSDKQLCPGPMQFSFLNERLLKMLCLPSQWDINNLFFSLTPVLTLLDAKHWTGHGRQQCHSQNWFSFNIKSMSHLKMKPSMFYFYLPVGQVRFQMATCTNAFEPGTNF